MTMRASTAFPFHPGRRLAWLILLLAVAAASASPSSALADGQFDSGFGTGGRVVLGLVNSSGVEGAGRILLLGDGRFLTAGTGKGSGVWVTQNLANGSLDSGFGSGGSSYFALSGYTFADDAARLPDGSIITAGGTTPVSDFDTLIDKFTPGGALDTSFGNDPPHPSGDGISYFDLGGDDIARAVTIDSTGKPVIAGRTGTGSAHDVLLARFNQDGSVDSSFGGALGVHTDLGSNDEGWAMAMQGDRIVVIASSGPKTFVLRYTPGGSLDTGFGGGDGIAPVAFPDKARPAGLLIDPDGRIVVAGNGFSPNQGYVERLGTNGDPDPSFAANGVQTLDFPSNVNGGSVNAIARGDDGKLIAAADTFDSTHDQSALFRLLPDGKLDPSWGANGLLAVPTPDPTTSEDPYAIAVQPDRRILIGGESYANSDANRFLIRLLGDTTPPDTKIVRAPKRKSNPLARGKFSFKALRDVNTTFQCKLLRPKRKHRGPHHARPRAKAPAFKPCHSPIHYRGLRRPGRYVFKVRAIDPAGNVDPTPARATVKVHKRQRRN